MVCDSRVEKYMEMFSVVFTETVINGIEWILMDRAKSALLSIKFRCFVVHYNGSDGKGLRPSQSGIQSTSTLNNIIFLSGC